MERFITTLVLTFLFSTLISAICDKFKDIGPYHLYKTGCCQDPLDVFEHFANGKYPEKPKILTVTDFLRDKKMGIKIWWNANLTYLKGFKIVFEYINNDKGKNICRVLDYSEFLKENKSISNHDFQFELYPVRKNNKFLVHLYPLPESENNYPPPQPVDTILCREWISRIHHRVKKDKLIVEFEHGPAKCNIVNYTVTLLDGESNVLKEVIVNSSQTTSNLTYEFQYICSGLYEVTIEIFDKNWNTYANCICKNMNQRCGEQCYRTKSEKFRVSGLSCTSPSISNVTTTMVVATAIQEPENISRLTIFLAIIGAMIGLLLLFLTFYCFKRSIREKRILLFYTEDHPYHCDAVGQFISFMNKNKCKIEAAASLVKGGDQLRLSLEIQKSDFLILIYSKALHKRIQAWKNNQDYINFLKEDNSALLTISLLKELKSSNKLIICKFSQMPNNIINNEFPSTKCYTLMKELNLLIQRIHGTGMDQELAILFKGNKLNHKFNSLTNAIKNAANFEENDSNWFVNKYFCPKKMDSLNEIVDYSEAFEPSIYSVPISYLFQQINENNDTIA